MVLTKYATDVYPEFHAAMREEVKSLKTSSSQNLPITTPNPGKSSAACSTKVQWFFFIIHHSKSNLINI
jgi:hypothetical protein